MPATICNSPGAGPNGNAPQNAPAETVKRRKINPQRVVDVRPNPGPAAALAASPVRPASAFRGMSRSTTQLRDLAERLIAYEMRRRKDSETPYHVILFLCEKLRIPLTNLMGLNGFRALLSRALSLASGEVAWLQRVHVKPDGTLAGLEEMHAKLPPGRFHEGKAAMLTQLLGLLVAFIGENLTLGIIREVWPRLDLKSLKRGNRIKNEKAKQSGS